MTSETFVSEILNRAEMCLDIAKHAIKKDKFMNDLQYWKKVEDKAFSYMWLFSPEKIMVIQEEIARNEAAASKILEIETALDKVATLVEENSQFFEGLVKDEKALVKDFGHRSDVLSDMLERRRRALLEEIPLEDYEDTTVGVDPVNKYLAEKVDLLLQHACSDCGGTGYDGSNPCFSCFGHGSVDAAMLEAEKKHSQQLEARALAAEAELASLKGAKKVPTPALKAALDGVKTALLSKAHPALPLLTAAGRDQRVLEGVEKGLGQK